MLGGQFIDQEEGNKKKKKNNSNKKKGAYEHWNLHRVVG
jgi:hypothetical protein